MSEHDRESREELEGGARRNHEGVDPEGERTPRSSSVKFTDKRRVRVDEGEHAPESTASEEPSELEQARKQATEYLEHLQRLQAEFANFRKRVLKEQTRTVELASEPLMRRLLEVLDEFDLALMAAEQK